MLGIARGKREIVALDLLKCRFRSIASSTPSAQMTLDNCRKRAAANAQAVFMQRTARNMQTI